MVPSTANLEKAAIVQIMGSDLCRRGRSQSTESTHMAALVEWSLAKKMLAIEETTANLNSEIILSPDAIVSLQNFLARSRVINPDLESPYSKYPNRNHTHASESGLGDQTINAILTERRQQLDAVLHDISGVDNLMDRIEDFRQQLFGKKDRITQSMMLHRRYRSAFWRLPVKLLRQIFDHCLSEDDRFRVSPKLAPLLLTRICRRWKEIAENMPSLWCSLSVIHPSGRSWEEASFWYDLWLKRSQGQPLSLEIHCFLDESTQIQFLLHPYNAQITSLRLLFANTTIEPELLLQYLPTLQELTLDWKGGCYRADITGCISRLPCTLRDLKFKGITVDPSKSFSFSTAWAHFKNVEITVQQPHHVLYVLQLCRNLSSLEICVASDGHFSTEVIQPFTHTNIQSLSVRCSSRSTSDSVIDMCNALTLPNLRVFEVTTYGYRTRS